MAALLKNSRRVLFVSRFSSFGILDASRASLDLAKTKVPHSTLDRWNCTAHA
jgi:hypothetical protein